MSGENTFRQEESLCEPLLIKVRNTLCFGIATSSKQPPYFPKYIVVGRVEMTISYDEEFSSLMLRWRGSLWKAVLKDMIAFYAAYYVVLAVQVSIFKKKKQKNNINCFSGTYWMSSRRNTSQDGSTGAKSDLNTFLSHSCSVSSYL